jgi:hypothetical protein
MEDYSAMISYQEKNNLHYFTFFPHSEKPIKAVIRHLPPDTPAEDISNSLENLDYVINVRQMTATLSTTKRTKPRRNPPAIPFFLNKKQNLKRYSSRIAVIILSS